MTTTTSLGDAALGYRSLGLSVIPCRPKGKEALIEWTAYQKEPPHTDEIVMWWERWPDANIAIILGNGLFAVDLDGDAALFLLQKAGITLPDNAPMVKTGNGFHIYLAAERPIANKTALLASQDPKAQVDIKRHGGYAICPPSIHPSGATYQWVRPWQLELPKAPDTLLRLLYQPHQDNGAKPANWLAEALKGVPEGQRNDTACKLAGYFLGKGIDADTVCLILREFALNCKPPFSEAELRDVIQSIAKREKVTGAAPSSLIKCSGLQLLNEDPNQQTTGWMPFLGQKGILGPGKTTLVGGHGKSAGKTTTMAHAIRQAMKTNPGLNSLWLTEEPRSIWRNRIKLFPELATERFTLVFANNCPWKEALKRLEPEQTDVLLIDTIRAFCSIQDENDAPAWHEAIWPLILMAREKNWTLILLHHLRKSQAETGLGHAGSHAIVGMVDIAVEIHRDQHMRTRRICRARSRYEESPEEWMIELRDGELITIGDPSLVEAASLQKRVLEVLDNVQRTRAELADLLDPRPSDGALKAALRALFDGKQVQREGRGVRKDPHRWFR